jgi:nucleoside-diphosphate-sugar epimerase
MKVFVTGASGLVGSELVRQLVPQGHTVFGLARSDASAEKLKSLGVTPVRGQHTDLEVIAKAASEADATIHCAFNHEAFATGEYMLAIEQDKAAITAMCDALVGSGKTFINTGGIFGSDGPDEFSNKPNTAGFGSRGQNEKLTTSYLDKGVRALNVRLPPITHGPAKEHPFASGQIAIAKARGFAGYVEEGKNVWSSCDVVPAAEVYVLAIDKSKVIPKGAALHAVYEEGVAKQIGRPRQEHLRGRGGGAFRFPGHDAQVFRGCHERVDPGVARVEPQGSEAARALGGLQILEFAWIGMSVTRIKWT